MMSLRPTAGLRCVKYTPGKMLLSSLSLVTLWALAFGDAFVCLQPPAQQQHAFAHATNAVTAVRHISTAADTSRRGVSSSLPVKAAVGEKGASTPESGDSAKQRFFRNLERKRAGESVPSSALYGDLALLQTPRGEEVRAHDVTTTVTATASWRGKWEICFAPHIETLSKLILTKFSTVEYIFDADDGRMVSHAGFESKVFGSGWFNADGRIVRVPSPASATTAGVKDEGRQGQEVVKVGKLKHHCGHISITLQRKAAAGDRTCTITSAVVYARQSLPMMPPANYFVHHTGISGSQSQCSMLLLLRGGNPSRAKSRIITPFSLFLPSFDMHQFALQAGYFRAVLVGQKRRRPTNGNSPRSHRRCRGLVRAGGWQGHVF